MVRTSVALPSPETVLTVEAPARLHLGFVDVSGSLGRRFGSLGLTLEDIATVLTMRRADDLLASGPAASRALEYVRRLADDFDPPCGVAVRVHRAIPEHVGLGSGTQLAFAVGRAFGALFGVPFDARATASRLDRGARSGIGIGAFDQGGFVVDGGRTSGGDHPPVIARLPFPASWRVLLLFDRAGRGLHGDAEREAFRTLRSFPESAAAHLAHLTLMRAMPALAEEDCDSFGAAIGEIQRTVGDYFAVAQGGRFTSPAVAQALAFLEARGVRGVGQTSWGPTGFAIFDSELRAHAALAELRSACHGAATLEFQLTRGRNEGHRLSIGVADRPDDCAIDASLSGRRARES